MFETDKIKKRGHSHTLSFLFNKLKIIVFRINTFIGSFRWQIYDKSSEIHDIILLIINTILSTCHFFLEFDAIYLN